MRLTATVPPSLLLLAASVCQAATLRVPADYPTIPDALDAAQEADTVLVAAGTYTAEVQRDLVFTDPPEVVSLVAGGFLPPGVTLLSADGPEVTTIAVSGGDDSHCLVAAREESDAPSRIDGFRFERTLTGAAAILAREMPDDWSLSIVNCLFEDLDGAVQAGGLWSVNAGRASVVDCTFSDVRGGPAFATHGSLGIEESTSPSVLEVRGCSFSNESGINMRSGARLEVTDCTFFGNSRYCGIFSNALETTVEDCRFADYMGYPVYLLGSVGAVRRCTFHDGTSLSGGSAAVYAISVNTTSVEDCWFERCIGVVGAIQITGSFLDDSAVVRNNVFVDIESHWGALRWVGVNGEISENTFYQCHDRDSSEPGAAIRVLSAQPSAVVELHRNIVTGSSGSSAVALGPLTQLAESCNAYWDNTAGHTVGFTMDATSFVLDPLFCIPESGGFTLSSQSPCLPGNHPDGADCGLIGALGEGCGPVSVEEWSWGKVKAGWR